MVNSMPYKKTVIAISRYLTILADLLERNNGKLVVKNLPDTIEVFLDGEPRRIRKSTLHRYIKWITWFYRMHEMSLPFRVNSTPFLVIEGDPTNLREEVERLLSQTDKFEDSKYVIGRARNITRVKRLESEVKELKRELNKLDERIKDLNYVIEKYEEEAETLKKRLSEAVQVIERLLAVKPEDTIKAVRHFVQGEINDIVDIIIVLIADAITTIPPGRKFNAAEYLVTFYENHESNYNNLLKEARKLAHAKIKEYQELLS
jgi:regulator of replication initiation timing